MRRLSGCTLPGLHRSALAIAGCLAAVMLMTSGCKRQAADSFSQLMTVGQGHLLRGDATNAITAYSRAVALQPESIDARLNLANAYLLAVRSQEAIAESDQALKLDHNSAAAYYIKGCALMRLNQPREALQAFQESQKIDPAVTPLDFQLGLAHEALQQWDDAIREFETVIQFEPEHPAANYKLAQLYQRVGRTADAANAMAAHQQVQAKAPGAASSVAAFESSKHTQPRIAFSLQQPQQPGVSVKFVDATPDAFGSRASAYKGPLAVLDFNHDGRNSLFLTEGSGFRALENTNGRFVPVGDVVPAAGGVYRTALVGDLNNDRSEDVLVLGEQVSHVFRFARNGHALDVTASAGLRDLKAVGGLLADVDFTGTLDLLTVAPGNSGVRSYRNLGNFYFQENTAASGLPTNLQAVTDLVVEDWNNEDVPGVFIARESQGPLFYPRQRAGAFVQTNITAGWPSGTAIALGDFNNDLLVDIVISGAAGTTIVFGGSAEHSQLDLKGFRARHVRAIDYDNDGWLDLAFTGPGLRLFRNEGRKGFRDVTSVTSLGSVKQVEHAVWADFDRDGDTDLVISSGEGIRFLKNEGGNANKQLKLLLVGNRSNASGIGVRVELATSNWRAIRTASHLPVEIGVGKRDKIDVLKTRWFDLATTIVDVPVQEDVLTLDELTLPTGSCPYLYAWDGKRFRFVSDILGASPLGLPASLGRYVEADPEEYLLLGVETDFVALDAEYHLRITEELREVLYLDHAKLVAVDHPAGTIVHTTSKMMPGKPFVPHELWTLKRVAQLHGAQRCDGTDLTSELKADDNLMAGPARLRPAQLRGLAEPYTITLDFGPLPVDQPLVLAMKGWIRFGGGMANVAGSLNPELPFPFPKLECELEDGTVQEVKTAVGVPAGKSKTILVDLNGKLPQNARRLRLTAAFELYWDQIELCTKVGEEQTTVTPVSAKTAEMRWHGYGEFENLPSYLPLTPRYDMVKDVPPWRRTPAGWCTKYGQVKDLLAATDNAMALLNGGDEVALTFSAGSLPPKQPGRTRTFFLYVVGWDKDADYHVGQGWRVEPLPKIGMDDQAYGRIEKPPPADERWQHEYNTRWVGPLVLEKRR